MTFAFAEVQAHVNYLVRNRQLAWMKSSDLVKRVVAI
jgi:hypothetical protein